MSYAARHCRSARDPSARDEKRGPKDDISKKSNVEKLVRPDDAADLARAGAFGALREAFDYIEILQA